MKLLTFVPLPMSGGFEVVVYEWDGFARLMLSISSLLGLLLEEAIQKEEES